LRRFSFLLENFSGFSGPAKLLLIFYDVHMHANLSPPYLYVNEPQKRKSPPKGSQPQTLYKEQEDRKSALHQLFPTIKQVVTH